MPRPVLLGLAATVGALALAPSGSAAPAGTTTAHRAGGAEHALTAAAGLRAVRDQAKALNATVDWLVTYPEDLWVGVEMPGPCRSLSAARRACPVAISIRAWTAGRLAPWRCEAQAVLPAPHSAWKARRTSARCHQLAETG